MAIIVDYETEEKRNTIITDLEAKGYQLVEDQRHFDGNHLIFEKPPRDLAAELDNVKARVENLEKR